MVDTIPSKSVNDVGDSEDIGEETDERPPQRPRERFTAEQRDFLMPYWNEFQGLAHQKAKHPSVTQFKDRVAEKYVKKFDLTEDTDRHRERVKRFFSNQKNKINHSVGRAVSRGITEGLPQQTQNMAGTLTTHANLSKKDADCIDKFFNSGPWKATAKRLFAKDNQDRLNALTKARITDIKAERAAGAEAPDERGVYSSILKAEYDKLDEPKHKEYEDAARTHNNEGRRTDCETVAGNQSKLNVVLASILTSLQIPTNSFNTGSCVFHLSYAYFSEADGTAKKGHIDVGLDGQEFGKTRAGLKMQKKWGEWAAKVLYDHCRPDVESESDTDSESEDDIPAARGKGKRTIIIESGAEESSEEPAGDGDGASAEERKSEFDELAEVFGEDLTKALYYPSQTRKEHSAEQDASKGNAADVGNGSKADSEHEKAVEEEEPMPTLPAEEDMPTEVDKAPRRGRKRKQEETGATSAAAEKVQQARKTRKTKNTKSAKDAAVPQVDATDTTDGAPLRKSARLAKATGDPDLGSTAVKTKGKKKGGKKK